MVRNLGVAAAITGILLVSAAWFVHRAYGRAVQPAQVTTLALKTAIPDCSNNPNHDGTTALCEPAEMAVDDRNGMLAVADSTRQTVRAVSPTGDVSVLAGTPYVVNPLFRTCQIKDGPGSSAR